MIMRQIHISHSVALCILLLFLGPFLALRASPEREAAIRAGAIQTHIERLASDEWKGRGSGEAGNEAAARYIAAAFQQSGLKPVGTARQKEAAAKADGSGYFQPFTFTAGVAKGKDN